MLEIGPIAKIMHDPRIVELSPEKNLVTHVSVLGLQWYKKTDILMIGANFDLK